MTLALQLLSYNGSQYLPVLFDSLRRQTDHDWHLAVLENSTVFEEKRKSLAFFASCQDLPFTFASSETNLGFAGGHQRLFEQHAADIVFLVNQDAILEPDFIVRVRSYLETHADVGAATGKILRWDWNKEGRPETQAVVDSLGLVRSATGKVTDSATGMPDLRVGRDSVPVFGISGCLPFYRRSAILDASHDGHLFDPAYGSYKEDVDLAYRLFRRGWKAVVLPEAVAYHQRSFRQSLLHRGTSPIFELFSYRNHWWNLLVHLTLRDLVRDAWAVVPFELVKVVFYLVKCPSVLRDAWKQTRARWPSLLAKRRALRKKDLRYAP
ncbi:glycosyltransferase family 2 protein [Candidatus Uhrbacteria bacterium]|nr:glycosyltransferase family 2 protein [Candidatus Uhrbacteria bacterium]